MFRRRRTGPGGRAGEALAGAVWCLGRALVRPDLAARRMWAQPTPVSATLVVLGLMGALGSLTLGEQVGLLARGLESTGDAQTDLRSRMLLPGLVRLVMADRLLPPPGLTLAWLILIGAVVQSVGWSRSAAVWAVLVLGLGPQVVQRAFEAVVTYLPYLPESGTLSGVLDLPRRVPTGVSVFWPPGRPEPAWVTAAGSRFNLFTAWSVVIWIYGLRSIHGPEGGSTRRHLVTILACVFVAGVLTWRLAPAVLAWVLEG